MILVKMAIRNIIRHKRRSLFTGLGMGFGCMLLSISVCISEGSYTEIIKLFTENQIGHVQIHWEDYLSDPSLYKSILGFEEIQKKLDTLPYIKSSTPRVHTGGLCYLNNKTFGLQIKGVDPIRENASTQIKKKLSINQYFSSDHSYEIIVAEKIMKVLQAKIGDDLVVITQAADGSISNDYFKIINFIPTDKLGDEVNVGFVPLKTIQEFLEMKGRIHEFSIVGNGKYGARKMAQKIKSELNNKGLDIQPWQVIRKDFFEAMQLDIRGNYITLGIIIFIVSLGVFNTVLMSVLERTREFGVLKALGTRPLQIFLLIIIEITLLSIFASVLGLFFASLGNAYFTYVGIDLTYPMEYGGITFKSLKGIINFYVFAMPFFVVVGVAIAVGVWPGIRAARVIPVKALRSV